MFQFSIVDAKAQSKEQTKSGKKSQALIKSTSIKPKPLETTKVGEVLLCKLRGYCEWPALVNSITNGIVNVTFFGDNTTAKTTIKNCFSFSDSTEFVMSMVQKKKNPLYSKSVKEAEVSLGIPNQNSIFNLIK